MKNQIKLRTWSALTYVDIDARQRIQFVCDRWRTVMLSINIRFGHFESNEFEIVLIELDRIAGSFCVGQTKVTVQSNVRSVGGRTIDVQPSQL